MIGICAQRQRAFTLVELMVTLAILVILSMIAMPSFVEFQRNAELTSTANKLLTAVTAARSEAIKQGRNTFVTPITNNQWREGWRVFVDLDNNNSFDVNTDQLVLQEGPLPAALQLTGNNNAAATPAYIGFNHAGFARSINNAGAPNLSMTLQHTASSTDAHKRLLLLARSGRARVCTPGGQTTGCTSSSSN